MANILFLAFVFGLFYWVYREPAVGCSIVITGFLMERLALATVPVAAENAALCNYIVASLAVFGVARQFWRYGTRLFNFAAPFLSVAALLAFTYATAIWAIFPSTTDEVLRRHAPYLVVLVGLAPLSVRNSEDLKNVISGIVWCSLASLGGLLIFGEWVGRSVVTLGSDEVTGPLTLTHSAGRLIIVAVLARETMRIPPRLSAGFLAVVSAVVLLIFLRTASRGQIIAAVLTLVAFSLFSGKRWYPLVVLALAGAALGSGLLDEEVARHSGRWDPDTAASNLEAGRMGPSESLLRFWSRSSPEHLLLGLGHGASTDPRLLGIYPHVVAVEVLAEEGLAGFLLFVVAILVSFVYFRKSFRIAGVEHGSIVRAFAAMAFYELVVSFKQGTLLKNDGFHLALILAGVCYHVLRVRQEAREVRSPQALV